MVACLGELGWPVSLGEDSSYKTGHVPEAQRAHYKADRDACKAQFGYDAPPPELSDAQLKELYPHRLWEWKCLDENGFGPQMPPSEQAFIDGYHSGKGTWTAYSQFTGSLPEQRLIEMFETCPRSR
jgi:hypothetical protein